LILRPEGFAQADGIHRQHHRVQQEDWPKAGKKAVSKRRQMLLAMARARNGNILFAQNVARTSAAAR
jgi:hypothetical protein